MVLPNQNTPIYIRNVCRGSDCVACDDGVATCILPVVVGLLPFANGGYLANITTLQRGVLYVFVAPDCMLGVSGLGSEFVSDNMVMISPTAEIASVRTVCTRNASNFVDIPVV